MYLIAKIQRDKYGKMNSKTRDFFIYFINICHTTKHKIRRYDEIFKKPIGNS